MSATPSQPRPEPDGKAAVLSQIEEFARSDLAPAPAAEPVLDWKTHTVKRGDTLGRIFRRNGLDVTIALRLAKHPEGKILRKLKPGRPLRFGYDKEGDFRAINYDLGNREWLRIDLADTDFEVARIPADLDVEHRLAGGTIRSSLFGAAAQAGLSDKLVLKLAEIFGWDIDFALDLRDGDQFVVAYEELYEDGKQVGSGDILAATFVNQDTVYRAFRHIDEHGNASYYDQAGGSMRGTFLRTPMRVSRVTSGFTKRRYHPVLKKWRAHKGVDYGAPRGTPVLSTADGRVKFVGRKGGYGKTIVLHHGGRFSTLYAHLSSYKKGIRSGGRVSQGQVIGFVGSTGLATGPHLHYEFRINGVHRNPLTYKTPRATALAERYREAFRADVAVWSEKMALFTTTLLASAE